MQARHTTPREEEIQDTSPRTQCDDEILSRNDSQERVGVGAPCKSRLANYKPEEPIRSVSEEAALITWAHAIQRKNHLRNYV